MANINEKKIEDQLHEISQLEFNTDAANRDLNILRRNLTKRFSASSTVKFKDWEKILKTMTPKRVAVVTILVLSMIGYVLLSNMSPGTNLAWSSTLTELSKQSWMHCSDKMGETYYTETWVCLKPTRIFMKGRYNLPGEFGGDDVDSFRMIDFSTGQEWKYTSNTNYILINSSNNLMTDQHDTYFEYLVCLATMFGESQDCEIIPVSSLEHEPDEYQYDVIKTDHENGKIHIASIYVNSYDNLPSSMIVHPKNSNSEYLTLQFDYPQTGPLSFYDLGVHEDTEIERLMPPDVEVFDIAKTHDEIRKSFHNFQGLSLWLSESLVTPSIGIFQFRENRFYTNGIHLHPEHNLRTIDHNADSLIQAGFLELPETNIQYVTQNIFPSEIPLGPVMVENIQNSGVSEWEIVTSDAPDLSHKIGCQLKSFTGGNITLHTYWFDPMYDYWVCGYDYEFKEGDMIEGSILKLQCRITAFEKTGLGFWYPKQIKKYFVDFEGTTENYTWNIYLEDIVEHSLWNRDFLIRGLNTLLFPGNTTSEK